MTGKRRIQIAQPVLGEEEWQALREPIETGWLTQGPKVAAFERAFAERHGVRHAFACSSCTTALHLILAAMEIGPGDEVIVPSFTWVATANAVLYCGARPVLVDVDRTTYNIDPAGIADKLSPRTRAIIAVHLFGLCADMDAIAAAAPGIPIVEDAACASGASWHGQPAGSIGAAAAFSFHPRKSITTGEGGMLTTDDDKLAARVKLFKFHGVSRDAWKAYGAAATAHYDTVLAGFKYNLTDIASALGIHQLRRLDGFIERRRQIAERYLAGLAGTPGLGLPAAPPYPHRHAWHLFTVLVDKRDDFMAKLKEQNIGSGLHFEAVHRLSLFKKGAKKLPRTEHVCARILSLPLFPDMTDQDAEDVVTAVRRLLA